MPIAVYDAPIVKDVTDYEEFPGDTDTPYSVQVLARVSGYMTRVYFQDGTMVRKGEKLFEIDPQMYRADYARSVGTVKQYEAHVERLQKEFNRAKTLHARGSISQEEHDRYKADYEEAEANLEVAKANRDLARLNLEWTEVTSPIDGLLSRRLVDPGNLVKADTTALTNIVSLDPLYVYFDVHEQAMLRIKRLMQSGKLKLQAQGTKAVPVDIALSDEPDYPHHGVVDFTDNKVDLNTGTLRFRARIDNPADAHGNRFIVPGLFVRVRLPIGDPHPATMIAEPSLVSDQGRKYVFVVEPKLGKDGRPEKTEKGEPKYVARRRDVGEVGVLRDGYREIEKGIQPGDLVVRAGMQRLKDGLDVIAEPYRAEAGPAGEAPGKDAPAKAQPGAGAPAARPASPVASPTGEPAAVTPRPASRLRGAGEPRTGKSR
jgi:membrane fusion protein, multidrug efflux system